MNGFFLQEPFGIITHSMTAKPFHRLPRVRHRHLLGVPTLLILLLVGACSLPPSKVKVPTVSQVHGRVTQSGIASWYGPGFHGKATASGTVYNQNDFTAAHQTLPLGTRVMVTNLQNGSSTEVTINDRGPFAKARIIDLSYAAGATLGMIGPGTIPVRLEVLDSPQPVQSIPASLNYTIQIGSFLERTNAQQLRERVAGFFSDVTIVPLSSKDTIYYRVRLGTFADRNAAEAQARRVSQAGYPAIIVEK